MKYFKTADEKKSPVKNSVKSKTKLPMGLCSRKNFNFKNKCATPALKFFPRMFKFIVPCSVFSQLALLGMISKWSRKLRKGADYSFVMKPLDRDWEKLQKTSLMEIQGWKPLISYFIFACLVLNFCLFFFPPEHLIHSPRFLFEWSYMSGLFAGFNSISLLLTKLFKYLETWINKLLSLLVSPLPTTSHSPGWLIVLLLIFLLHMW